MQGALCQSNAGQTCLQSKGRKWFGDKKCEWKRATVRLLIGLFYSECPETDMSYSRSIRAGHAVCDSDGVVSFSDEADAAEAKRMTTAFDSDALASGSAGLGQVLYVLEGFLEGKHAATLTND